MVGLGRRLTWAVGTYLGMYGAPALAAPLPQVPALERKGEEILVVGRRSGVPMWRVRSGVTTLVLVGTIDGVAKSTTWDAGSLVQALRMADRVMFPQAQQVTVSPFAMISYLAKWRGQVSLPKGQTLESLLTARQFQRLRALQQRGMLRKGVENRHPLHVAFELRDAVKDQAGGYGQNADRYVMATVKKYRLRQVPIQKSSAKPLAARLFGATPSHHVTCLDDAMTLAEAGPGAVVARSQAWAGRRVAAVLNSPADQVFQSCFPADPAAAAPRQAALQATVSRLLLEPKVTVAVLDLHSLAAAGGVLDRLRATGLDVSGPAWR